LWVRPGTYPRVEHQRWVLAECLIRLIITYNPRLETVAKDKNKLECLSLKSIIFETITFLLKHFQTKYILIKLMLNKMLFYKMSFDKTTVRQIVMAPFKPWTPFKNRSLNVCPFGPDSSEISWKHSFCMSITFTPRQ